MTRDGGWWEGSGLDYDNGGFEVVKKVKLTRDAGQGSRAFARSSPSGMETHLIGTSCRSDLKGRSPARGSPTGSQAPTCRVRITHGYSQRSRAAQGTAHQALA
jgi:hypothetical protein